MRSIHHVRYVLAFVVAGATAACTSLLGSYEVSGGDATAVPEGGGPGSEGGPSADARVEDTFVPNDSPTDSPPACAAPKTVCGSACVDLGTDKDNCGACGRSCLGGRCTARACEPFALANRTDVLDRTIAATDTDVFFGTTANDLVQQPVMVGAAPIKLATAGGEIRAIAPLPNRVFFTAVVSVTGPSWEMWKAVVGTPGSGGANNASVGGTPVGAVLAGAYVHTTVVTSTAPENFQIVACPIDGTACFGNFNGAGRPGDKLAAGNGYVFWTDQLAATVFAYPDGVGLRTPISTVEGTPNSPAWDGTTLFWQNAGSGRLRKSAYPMPSATDFRDIVASANDVIVDAVNVYWSIYNGMDNDLFAAAKTLAPGSAPTHLTHGPNIGRLAQNATGIYWFDGTAVRGIRKP